MSCNCCQKICLQWEATRSESKVPIICGYWDATAEKWYKDKTTTFFFVSLADPPDPDIEEDQVHTTKQGVVEYGTTCTADTSEEPDTPEGYVLDHTAVSYSNQVTNAQIIAFCNANMEDDSPETGRLYIAAEDWYLYRQEPPPEDTPSPSMVAYTIALEDDEDAWNNAGGIIKWRITWTQICHPVDCEISYEFTQFPLSGGSSVIAGGEVLVSWEEDSEEVEVAAAENTSRRFDFLGILLPL